MCDSAITRSDRENDLFVGNAAGQTGPSYTLLVILVTQAIVLTFTLHLWNLMEGISLQPEGCESNKLLLVTVL